MIKKLIADVNPHEVRVALTEDGNIAEIHIETRGKERLVGNIYKGRAANILPGMQAAFVDVGLGKNAFLYAGDIYADEQDFEFEESADEQQPKKSLEIPNIKDILKPGQEILVQVLKQPGGTKGARVTTHITLPGRLIVLMPTVEHVGVSRRIEDEDQRIRLKELAAEKKPEHMGVIVRTAAQHASDEEIINEIEFYSRLWRRIVDKAEILSAPRLIHAEENLLFRTVRDIFTEDVCEFTINDEEYYQRILALVNIISPNMKDRLKLYKGNDNIFDVYNIEDKLNKALQRKVWLKNGCYLIIDETEALTVIDVNTGKYIGEDDFQKTALNANIEAAHEIARQLRLRDISGIIIIDFIDMESEESKRTVVEELEKALSKDRTKSNVKGMTQLGLVEMTRKKMRRKLSTLTERTCPVCGGTGKVHNLDNMAMRVRREAVRTVKEDGDANYLVEVAPDLAEYIISKNNQNQTILPNYEHARFYIAPSKDSGLSQINITKTSRKEDLNGAHIFY